MRVLLTGGAGFIGQHLARRLVAEGHEVTALDALLPQVHLDPQASRRGFPGRVIVADVTDEDAWAAVPGSDAVVHLAAETGTGQSMYETHRYELVNVEGTRLAGRAARRWGAPVVSMSSRAVYGEGRYACAEHGTAFGGRCCDAAAPAPSTEADEHRPVSVYGQTKSRAERVLVDEVAGAVPVVSVRPQNVVGPGQALHNPYTGVLAAWLAMLREGRPLTVYGDGLQTRDLVHVTDVAAVLAWLVAAPPPAGAPLALNVGSGERTTLTALAAYAISGAPVPSPGITHLDVHRAGDITHACADLTLLDELGAPHPRWSTADAVGDFVSWSWDKPGAAAQAWDAALGELADRGLVT